MTKFETANELISFVKEKDLKSGFYQKGKRMGMTDEVFRKQN